MLHVAAYANSVNVARMLVAEGHDVNCANIAGNTPLHIAAQYNGWEVADLLISHGAEINTINNEGQTPLDVAVAYENKQLIELLELTQGKICSSPCIETNQIIIKTILENTQMSERAIFITEYDAKRLLDIINDPSKLQHREPDCLKSLEKELSRAQIVASKEIPPDVVTMNSSVCVIDMETGEEESYTLVFPDDADVIEGRISILAPIGTAMLGYKAGDSFEWDVPGGKRHLKIKEIVYQPESSGDYHL
jgi:regulator of nucleoside diphosphate kinase